MSLCEPQKINRAGENPDQCFISFCFYLEILMKAYTKTSSSATNKNMGNGRFSVRTFPRMDFC